MSPPPIRFHSPLYDERELEAVRSALAVQTTGDGPIGRRVEGRLSKLLAGRRVLLTTSCTHALELALLALGVGPGHEVICPSFTFVSTRQRRPARRAHAPVFAEIDERTLGLDPADVERRLTPRTAALLPVHYAGVAPDMDALLDHRAPARPARGGGRRAGPGRVATAAGRSAPSATPAASASTRRRT